MSLSRKISQYFAHSLRSRGFTQEGLEKKLHMSQATLSDLCNDRCRWNARHLERIAPAFGQTPGEFVTAAEAYRPQRAKKAAKGDGVRASGTSLQPSSALSQSSPPAARRTTSNLPKKVA